MLGIFSLINDAPQDILETPVTKRVRRSVQGEFISIECHLGLTLIHTRYRSNDFDSLSCVSLLQRSPFR